MCPRPHEGRFHPFIQRIGGIAVQGIFVEVVPGVAIIVNIGGPDRRALLVRPRIISGSVESPG